MPATELCGVGISCHGIVKHFPQRIAVDGVDLEVAAGESVALVGRSGCGKSTLLRLLAGLDSPSAGRIDIDGQTLRSINRRARVMFQDACLFPWKRIEANVRLGLQRDRHHAATNALMRVGLANRAHDWPLVLSGGQRQRVSLARALASEPGLLLLDEPLGALDALTRCDMQALIEQVWSQQRFTLVLVTHDVEEAVALADRVLVMDHGRWTGSHVIDLPRPRDRESSAFVALKRAVLDSVMAST